MSSGELTDIANVRLLRPRSGVFEALLKLCTVSDVGYLRKSMKIWAARTASHNEPGPLFNWVSIRNFHADTTSWIYCLDSSEQMSMLEGGQLVRSGLGAEALMCVREGHVVPCDAGHRKSVVYVNFLEVAPWNHPTAQVRYFRSLGPILLRAACDLSLQRGHGGRLGLHAVPKAEDFYHRVGFRSIDCPNEYNEVYMELDETGAQALLDQGVVQ